MSTLVQCSRQIKTEYIFFDLDGTLTDPYEGITKSVAYALVKFGIHIEDRAVLKCFIGPPLNECFMEKYSLSLQDSFRAVDYFREYFSVKGIFENKVFDKIPELLEKLNNSGYKLVVATSKPTVFANKILEKFDLKKYFCGVYGSELDGERVHKSDVIKYAIKDLHIDNPDKIIMIGDRKHDILGAKQSSIKSVGVLWGYGSPEELTESGADYICEAIENLEALLVNGDE